MARVSRKESDASIGQTRPVGEASRIEEPKKPYRQTAGRTLYDKVGQVQDVLPEDQVMAEFRSSTNSTKYLVRVNRKMELYNTVDKTYAADSRRDANLMNQTPFQMIEVEKATFENYLKFLQTGNVSMLTIAQRGL